MVARGFARDEYIAVIVGGPTSRVGLLLMPDNRYKPPKGGLCGMATEKPQQ